MMRRALIKHPHVCCRAEMVAQEPELREVSRDWGISVEALRVERGRGLITFLDRYVFSSRDGARQAMGCKLFYYHADVTDPEEPWRWLSQQADLRVIHLQRRNHLRRFLSRHTAQATGEWMRRGTKPIPTAPTIEVRLEDFLADVRLIETARSVALARLSRQKTLTLYYEDMVADFAGHMTQVQEFLEVRPMALTTDTFKQNTHALAERISNFEALRASLAGTPYAWMVND